MTIEQRLAILKAEKEGLERGREIERELWEAKLKAESENDEEPKKWVTTKEAKVILGRTSYNTLMLWVAKGIIKPPKKIGRPLYWERENLLKATPDGQE